MDIVRQVSIHRTGQAGDETKEFLDTSEVQLNEHSCAIENLFPAGHDPLHVLPQFGDEDIARGFVEFLGKISRYIASIGYEDSPKVFVELEEHRAIRHIARSQSDGQDTALEVRGQMQFEPVKPTFSGMSPFCQCLHGFVPLGVLVQADGDVSGIGMLDGMRFLSVDEEQDTQKLQGKRGNSVERGYQCFVGAVGLKDTMDGFLGLDALGLLEDRHADRV